MVYNLRISTEQLHCNTYPFVHMESSDICDRLREGYLNVTRATTCHTWSNCSVAFFMKSIELNYCITNHLHMKGCELLENSTENNAEFNSTENWLALLEILLWPKFPIWNVGNSNTVLLTSRKMRTKLGRLLRWLEKNSHLFLNPVSLTLSWSTFLKD